MVGVDRWLLLITLSSINVESFMNHYSRSSWVTGIRATSSDGGFPDQKSYLEDLQSRSTLPAGFSVGAARFSFTPFEVEKTLPMNLTIIMADKPSDSFAAMFTSNKFPGGPIIVGRERMKSSPMLQAIVINNKISNVCPGGSRDFGATDSDQVCQAVADQLGLPSKTLVLPSSTGIIGWKLPVAAIKGAVPVAAAAMQSKSIYPAALGITTTDRYPKVRSEASKSKKWSIVGIAKGAGMIEPNMATMLSYILTDLDLPRAVLSRCLRNAVGKSFNTITVDGDQSTSDTVVVMSSKCVASNGAADEAEFELALSRLCRGLAEDIVRNGEGTQHVVKVSVTGAPTDLMARDLGRFVINSNLVKCAIAGCDPNVGRIVGAIGSFLGNVENGSKLTEGLSVTLGGVDIFKDGAFQLDPAKEKLLSDYMFDTQLFPASVPEHDRNYPTHMKNVDIEIKLASGSGSCEVIGSDLTKEYVEVNADYRS